MPREKAPLSVLVGEVLVSVATARKTLTKHGLNPDEIAELATGGTRPFRSGVAAIDCQPRWRERLGEITVPTLVVHGDEDPFFPHGNGVALAAEIPGATLLTLPGIGQGVPRATWPDVAEALLRHTS